MSDLTKIAAKELPARRRSKLEPYLMDLRRLQNDGYSLEQLSGFLKEIGIEVSRQTIHDFLKRRESVTASNTEEENKNKTPGKSNLTEKFKPIEKIESKISEAPAVKDVQTNYDLSLSSEVYDSFRKKE